MRWALVAMMLAAAPAAAATEIVEHRIEVGGQERRYGVVDPTDGRAPVPLLIALHGGGGNGRIMLESTGFDALAAREGFIVVVPEGSGRREGMGTWNGGGCCNYASREDIDDVGFIRAVIAEVKRTYRVDASRIYVAGLSNGGMLTHRVAMALSNEIAAAATVVAAQFGDEPRAAGPVPMLIMNGLEDSVVPFEGGISPMRLVARSQSKPFMPAPYQAEYWVAADGCTGEPSVEETADYIRRAWTSCREGSEVVFYAVKDADHGWLGHAPARRRVADRPTGRIDATELVWAFFSRHRR